MASDIAPNMPPEPLTSFPTPEVHCTPRKTRSSTAHAQEHLSPSKQTPRKHRKAAKATLPTADEIRQLSINTFHLSYIPDDWQIEIVKEVHEGKDSIFIAGTGYGKSYVFETLALLGERKVVLVICPLKALEYDQVCIIF